ncbi:diguanylate cyclase [Chitiniphilus purpureus]|uniref:diguanylate cyclase n=1 Tax=Chitiniphilus purpureus TaxID=2981137 RepID=A0ABY6DH48_9NEIS|nr:diguanylate cyclase [Chitiniphilus sp. CD1]UXY13672.1 diguanylate cyclase [Chitiniphilus sp. CD1]
MQHRRMAGALDADLALIDAYMHTQPEEAIRVCERVFAQAWEARDPLAHVIAAQRYGLIMDHRGRGIEARDTLFEALQIAQSAHLFDHEAQLLEQIARGYYTAGQYRLAIQYWARCVEVSEQSGKEVRTWISAKVGLGQVYFAMGDYESATALHHEALARLGEVDDPYLDTKVKINLGVDLTQLGRSEEATTVFLAALDLCLMHRFSDYAAEACLRLAQVRLAAGRLKEASSFLDTALGHARGVKYLWAEAHILATQAQVQAAQGQHALALQNVKAAQAIAQANGFVHMANQQHLAAAEYAEAMGDLPTALAEFKLAYEYEHRLMAGSSLERNQELEDKAGLRPSANRLLVELSVNPMIDEGDLVHAFRLITRESCRILNVNRASIWAVDTRVDELRCQCIYLADHRRYRQGRCLRHGDFPALFSWLCDPNPLIAHDAAHHPYTWELEQGYLRVNNIKSVLAFTIRVAGHPGAVICFEVAGQQRNWTPDDVVNGGKLADISARVIGSFERKLFQKEISALNAKLMQANEALEARVIDRTAALERRNAELLELNETIRIMATIDELTGIYNRRSVMEAFRREQARSNRIGSAFCLCLIDVDHFKQVNDACGHLVGDEVLRRVAQVAREQIRETDSVGRYGGEEFLILLVDTDLEGARASAERLRHHTESLVFPELAPGFKVTVSIGLSQYIIGEQGEQVLSRADAALYQAKAQGRNRVVVC